MRATSLVLSRSFLRQGTNASLCVSRQILQTHTKRSFVTSRPLYAAAETESKNVEEETKEEEWEESTGNEEMFQMTEEGEDKFDFNMEGDELLSRNPRWEFHPHVKSMDQFHIREIVRIGRHMKAMEGGRQMSFSALVLIGNGSGSAGLGYGKALKVQDAVRAANVDAEKNVVHIKRYEGTRNVANVVVRNKGCIVFMKALAKDAGVKGNYLVQKMAEAFGLDGVNVKVIGPRSKNIATRAKTIFQALQMQRDPEAEARVMGKLLFNPNKVWRRRPYESIY